MESLGAAQIYSEPCRLKQRLLTEGIHRLDEQNDNAAPDCVLFLFVLFVAFVLLGDVRVKKQAEIFALSSLRLGLQVFLIIVLGVKLCLYIFGPIWEHELGASCSGRIDAVHATPLAGCLYFFLSFVFFASHCHFH